MKQMFRRAGPVLLLGLMGCEARPTLYRADPPDKEDCPRTVAVAEARLTLGFAKGVLRKDLDVASFRISRHPTTAGQYRACVKAGACSEPPEDQCSARGPSVLEMPNYQASRRDQAIPITCVGYEQAQAYCQWLGGDLPTLEQWTLSARGRGVARFAWGRQPAGCAEHPLADRPQAGPPSSHPNSSRIHRCADDGEDKPLRVGKHPKGASPAGVEDVLLTRGELVKKTNGSLYAACDAPNVGCVVVGTEPGAIDAVAPVLRSQSRRRPEGDSTPDASAQTLGLDPYAFRCVWRDQ